MSEIVERAAKALYTAEVGSEAGWDSERFGGKGRDIFRARARAVIAAIREPTRAMIDEGHRADPLACDVGEADVVYCYTTMWQAMIDEILE